MRSHVCRISRTARRYGGAVALIVAAAPRSTFAQQVRLESGVGDIRGTVLAADGKPIADAMVFVVGTRKGSVTDAGGRYRIAEVVAGDQKVVAQRIGFATDTASVSVSAVSAAQADFRLRDAAAIVAPVVVSATRERQRRDEASATIDVLDGAEVRRTRAAHPSGLMNRIPGVHVSELSGEGHSMSIRQPITTKPMYLYLEDGVPTRATGFFNHNALYEVNIPQSAGVEVLKGPGTALYGSDAIGGVVNVLTQPAPLSPTLEANLEAGAFGYSRLLLSGGGSHGKNGVRADVNVTHSDNWKKNAPFTRESGTLRWDATTSGGLSVRTVLTGSNIEQQDVPAISSAQFRSDRTINLAPIAFRSVKALRLTSAIDMDRGASLWSITPYARINDMGLLPSWQLSYDPQVWDTKNNSVGFLAKYRRDFASMHARMIIGVDGDDSPGRFTANQAVTTRTGPSNAWTSYTLGSAHYDYDVTYRSVSPYLHTEATVVDGLRIDAGLRADFSGYDYHTRLAPLDTGAHRRPADTKVSYSHLSPKLGATYTLSRNLNLFASYRNGFRAPSQGQLFQQNSAAHTVDLQPVTVNSYELGMRGEARGRLLYQLSAYDMTIRNDIITFVTSQNTREATNAGQTRHRGIEAAVGAALTTALKLDASYSVSNQRYVDWTPQAARPAANGKPAVAQVSYSGNRIEQAPRDLASAMLSYSPRVLGGGRIAAEWSHTGRYSTDPANTHSYLGHDLLNLHANAMLRGNVELFGRLTNVTNRAYAELLAYDQFQGDQYTPGAPRTFYTGLRLGLSR